MAVDLSNLIDVYRCYCVQNVDHSSGLTDKVLFGYISFDLGYQITTLSELFFFADCLEKKSAKFFCDEITLRITFSRTLMIPKFFYAVQSILVSVFQGFAYCFGTLNIVR